MRKFIIAAGHTASGNVGCGVVDRLDESYCTREIASLVVSYLEQLGHYAKLIRIDKSNSYRCQDCHERAEEANDIAESINIDLYVEIHMNAGGGSGSEVFTISKSEDAKSVAQRISKSLSQKLEIPDRGVKSNNLIVLRKTVMPAILVECLFADSSDADKYNADVIARAIVNGLVGENCCENNLWKMGWNRNDKGWWYCTDAVNKYYYTSKHGWKLIDEEWYRFNEEVFALENTWYYDEEKDKWYYFDDTCIMVRTKEKGIVNEKIINGEKYKFNRDGQLL